MEVSINKLQNFFFFFTIHVLLLPTWSHAQTASQPSGSGTQADPYLIANLNNLYWVTQNNSEWDKHYLQTADIDASSTSSWPGYGYVPIGNTSTKFSGVYDGDGHTISGIYMDAGGYRGLFGYTDGAEIRNVGVTNVDITANADRAGALVGYNDNSTITNCYSTGTIHSSENYVGGLLGYHARSTLKDSYSKVTVSGDNRVGGLTGGITSANSSTGSVVKNSYSTGDVSGNYYVGGLSPHTFESSIIKSYATGNVNGINDNIGGLVGSHTSSSNIEDSFATGNVTGKNVVGGLVGGNNGIITNSFSAGKVEGSSDIGGLVGEDLTGTVNSSYWNTETSQQGNSAGGIGLTTSQMKQQSSFSGWDFSNTWSIEEGTLFPYLQNTTHRIGGPEIAGPEEWHMYGTPFENTSFDSFTGSLWTQGFQDATITFGSSNLLLWDETSQQWNSPGSLNDSPNVGQGFLLHPYEDDDYDNPGVQGGFPKSLVADGQVNTLPQSVFLSYNNGSNSSYDGFNLIANPTASTVDWDQVSRSNVSATYYVWDPAGAHYDTYQSGVGGTNGGTSLIAPFQGFWAKANSSSASVNIDSSAVSNSHEIPYKLAKKEIYSILLHMENSEGYSDEVRLVLHENSSAGFDSRDAVALTPLSKRYIKIGTAIDGKVFSIDSRPATDTLSFDLTMHGKNAGETAEVSLVENTLPDDWTIQLVHLPTGVQYNLRRDSPSIELKKSPSKDLEKIKKLSPVVLSKNVDWQIVLSTTKNANHDGNDAMPDSFALDQNYPNPFNPSTIISYRLPVSSEVQLEVFDLTGRSVATLVDDLVQAGAHEVKFDASDLSSGIYIYRLKTGEKEFSRKLTLIK